MVIFTAQFHKTKTEIRFWPGSNSAIAMSEVCDGENLTRWSRPDLRLSLINHSAKAIHHYIPFLTIILDITHFTNQEIILKRLYMWNCLFSLVNQHCVKSVQIRSFFWSVFSHIRTEYGETRIISPHSARMPENTDQKKLRMWTLSTQHKAGLIFSVSKDPSK